MAQEHQYQLEARSQPWTLRSTESVHGHNADAFLIVLALACNTPSLMSEAFCAASGLRDSTQVWNEFLLN